MWMPLMTGKMLLSVVAVNRFYLKKAIYRYEEMNSEIAQPINGMFQGMFFFSSAYLMDSMESNRFLVKSM